VVGTTSSYVRRSDDSILTYLQILEVLINKSGQSTKLSAAGNKRKTYEGNAGPALKAAEDMIACFVYELCIYM
jgi:hypothetical protein